MVLSEVKEALSRLEKSAHHDMTGAQTTIWGEDPGHIVLMHARFLQAAFLLPRPDWPWENIKTSWLAILARRHLPYVMDWLEEHELRLGLFIAQNEPRAMVKVMDRLGRVHTLQRA